MAQEKFLLALLEKFLIWMKIDTKIVRASDYNFKKTKSDLILEMCQTLKFDKYLFGELGKNYCDVEKFKKDNVQPFFQKYNHNLILNIHY